jgi:AraC-like DNA-binding protein
VYREQPSQLTGAVLWHRTVDHRGAQHTIVPDGCVDLIWRDGELLVAGPDTGPHLTHSPPGASSVGLRFAPGTGPALLGTPADELRDQRVPLGALWSDARVRQLVDRLDAGPGPARGLESWAVEAMPPPDPATLAIAARVRAGWPVDRVADAVGLSARQLHRRCLPAFGYGPKTLGRILRMGRALALARDGLALARVAAVTGYADQAHLTREVKALTGASPGTLLD